MIIFIEFIKRVGEKRDKMRGLLSILSLFRNEFTEFNITRPRMLDYLSCDIKITLKSHFCRKNLIFCYYVHNVVMDVITFPVNLYTTGGLSILLHGVISLQDATSYDKPFYIIFIK